VSENYDDDKTQSFTPLIKDTLIGHYRIVEKIGAGGMGEVYLAEDTKLNREVALKFLPSHLCQDEDCRKRFTREAQAAAKLSHPNIIHVYEVSEYQGRPFFAMEHVEGLSLKEFSAAKDPTIEWILELGIQICEGLNDAHEKGVTHRDIKPSNILIDSHGRAKIVDFGLASVVGTEQLTKTGSTLGTIGYMSPEQVQGKEIDHRSDLFSLGVVLYELIAWQNPFKRDSEAATLKAVSDDLPEPLARFKSGLPNGLQSIIDKALEKDVKTRYQHSDGMLSDLLRVKRLMDSGESTASVSGLVRRSSRFGWIATAIIIVVAGMVLLVTKPWITDTSLNESHEIMLAVLPFENLGDPEDEYFANGMTEEITTHVAKLSGLGVISRSLGVISRSSIQHFQNVETDQRKIGQELGVDYILEGTVRWDKSSSPELVRIAAQLIRVADNTHTWAENYERPFTQIFEIQEDIASEIGIVLNMQLLELKEHIENVMPTENTEAYHAYLRGLSYLNNPDEDPGRAAEALKRAVAYDSTFALAYAELSRAQTDLHGKEYDTTNHLAAARRAVDRALELDPELLEAHVALVYYYTEGLREHDRALEKLRALRNKVEDKSITLRAEATILGNLGKFDEALASIKAALELDPESARISVGVAGALMLLRRYPEAIYYCDRSIALVPDQEKAYLIKAMVYHLWQGNLDKAREALKGAPHEHTAIHWNQLLYERDFTGYLEELEFIKNVLIHDIQRGWFSLLTGEALIYLNRSSEATLQFDSSLVYFKSIIDWQDNETIRAALGRVYAWLGRKENAVREGRAAVDMCPIVANALEGPEYLVSLAHTYVIIGEYEEAVNTLDQIMTVSFELSAPVLQLDPRWDPLRDHPRFQALIEKYEKKHGT